MAPARSADGRGGVLRAMLLVLAIGLAAAATAGVVTSEDPQVLRLAVVGALWAFVLVALAAPRQPPRSQEPRGLSPGKEVDLRRTYEVELEREVSARREYEMQLEVHLRRELERGLQEEVQGLRDEVQRLRGELIDRLDGELRMERIETTRLIGGSLRACRTRPARSGSACRSPRTSPSRRSPSGSRGGRSCRAPPASLPAARPARAGGRSAAGPRPTPVAEPPRAPVSAARPARSAHPARAGRRSAAGPRPRPAR